ncbi:MAG: glycosyltransferase family A protein [Acidobacteriota bacterium]
MERASVSVVIPTFNRASIVGEAVASALAQTHEPADVVVVDDGSTDDTASALDAYRGRILYVRQQNAGPAAARNTGIRHTKSRYVAFLDSDDLWAPEKLRAQMSLFASDPSLAVVSCLARYVAFDGRTLAETGPPQDTLRAGDRTGLRRLLLGNTVSGGSSAVVRRECLDDVGVFDEELWGVEDWDMWLRVAKKYSIGFVNQPLTIMRSGAANLSATANVATMLANELRLLDKHFADGSLGFGWYDRGMAISERYGRAAWAYYATGHPRQARRCLARALANNPVHFLSQRAFPGLFARTLIGQRSLATLRRVLGSRSAARRSS